MTVEEALRAQASLRHPTSFSLQAKTGVMRGVKVISQSVNF